jgi:hypothetical protein
MPDRQRALIAAARTPRDRFAALVDASDLQLQEIAAAPGDAASFKLQLYEATILAANRRLRSREAAVPPRDRLFKRFEQRLTRQIAALKTLLLDLDAEHVDAGRAASDTAKKLRLAALSSAIDADASILRDAENQER